MHTRSYTGHIHCLKPLSRCKIHTRMQMCDKTAHGSEWQVGKHCHNFLDDIHRYMQTQHHDCTTQHFHPIPGAMHPEQYPPPPPQLLLLSPLRMSTIISVIKILCYFHADFCFTASAVSPPQNKSEKMNAVSPPQTENEKIIYNFCCICVLST